MQPLTLQEFCAHRIIASNIPITQLPDSLSDLMSSISIVANWHWLVENKTTIQDEIKVFHEYVKLSADSSQAFEVFRDKNDIKKNNFFPSTNFQKHAVESLINARNFISCYSGKISLTENEEYNLEGLFSRVIKINKFETLGKLIEAGLLCNHTVLPQKMYDRILPFTLVKVHLPKNEYPSIAFSFSHSSLALLKEMGEDNAKRMQILTDFTIFCINEIANHQGDWLEFNQALKS